jgi:hypothetical protein
MLEELGGVVPRSLFLLDSFIDKETNTLAPEAMEPLKQAVSLAARVARALSASGA